MKTKITILEIFLFFSMLPLLIQADCVDLSLATSYSITDHMIHFYRGDTLFAWVQTAYHVPENANLTLMKSIVCDNENGVFEVTDKATKYRDVIGVGAVRFFIPRTPMKRMTIKDLPEKGQTK